MLPAVKASTPRARSIPLLPICLPLSSDTVLDFEGSSQRHHLRSPCAHPGLHFHDLLKMSPMGLFREDYRCESRSQGPGTEPTAALT